MPTDSGTDKVDTLLQVRGNAAYNMLDALAIVTAGHRQADEKNNTASASP
jgi:hypothetical protein